MTGTGKLKRILLTLSIVALLLVSCGLTGNEKGNLPLADSLASLIPPQPTTTPTATPTPQPRVRITLGEEDILKGDFDNALSQYWTARSESTDPGVIAAAQLGAGRVLLAQSDYKGAVDQFNWLLANFDSGESRNSAYFFLAQSYEALNEYRLAAEAYGNYAKSQPGPLDSEILERQGDALIKANDPASAVAAYQAALKSATPTTSEPLIIKAAQASSAAGDDKDAVTRLLALYESSTVDYIKSQANFLLGQIYLRMNETEQAYSRFQDSVIQFPTYYDTYSGLVALVEAGQPVNELMRGIVDYYAGQYGLAVTALDRYMNTFPDHDGTPHYYKALSLWQIGDYPGEISEWDALIQDHPTDKFLAKAYLEKSSTQWRYLEDYVSSADTLLQFVARIPDAAEAAEYLFTAGNIYEIGGYLTKASETWQRVFNEYPGYEKSYEALFRSGITTYRLQKYMEAQIIFQKLLVLTSTPEEIAAANFWVAKCMEKLEKGTDAISYFEQAAKADPTGYYSIRASEILEGQPPFPPAKQTDFAINLEEERKDAEKWMRSTFNLEQSVVLSSPGELVENILFKRGEAYWKLGMRDRARAEFESLRSELKGDAVNTFRLMNHMVDLGFYQSAALSSRQVLDMAGLSQAATLTEAPKYFNHIRFGIFYRDLIVPVAVEHNIDPLLIFSIIRQESLFDASITSSAGARGLMQITRETGEYIASNYNWPPNYTASDLDRPMINIRLGTHYLKYWIDKYNGSIPAALASYNAGDANNMVWIDLAGGDADLYLEIIRFDETRNYIRYIAENYSIYKSIYTHP